MPIRSMTGFAQAKGQLNGQLSFSLSVKSVNHRFLDMHFRMPSESDALEMKLRRLIKEKVARGHVELALSVDRSGAENFVLNRELVAGYIKAFRTAAAEFNLAAEPDLNVIMRMVGAMETAQAADNEELEAAVLSKMEGALERLNLMREEEGRGIEKELRGRMVHLRKAAQGMEKHRQAIVESYLQKLNARLTELVGAAVEKERVLQEAAMIADRSDIQEEIVRLDTHVKHFLGLLDEGGEIGKKLDFLLQEMNREANTLLSKTSGLAGEALKITELGLAMKAEVEKAREQVQNLE